MPRTTALAACLVLSLMMPLPALAGGGLFLDAAAPIGVEQIRQRVLFTIHDDGTITLDAEITWSGSPEAFAWVLPVPAPPQLGTVPPSTLRLLDYATAPRIIPPPITGELADEGDDDDSALDDDDDDGAPPGVEELEQVGPYDPTVVTSDDLAELLDWFDSRGYLVTEEMEPRVAAYVEAGMSFLCLELAPDAGVADIEPISITWTGSEPLLPLLLTGVAAEPEMGIVVFVAGETTWEPLTHSSLLVDSGLLQADPRNGQNNYFPLLSWLADQEDGQAFFTEYSAASTELAARLDGVWMETEDVAEARQYLEDLVDEHGWITRMYTRMSADEMVIDPVFGSMGSTATIGDLHDLSGRPAVHVDPAIVTPLACNDTYCGLGGICASTDFPGVHGCVCDDGYVARRIEGPRLDSPVGTPSVACQDADFDLLASAADLIAANDPCEAWDCGAGSCVVVGGMAACDCDDGMAGVVQGERVGCVLADELYGPDQLLWPGWPEAPAPDPAEGDGDRVSQGSLAEAAAGCGCSASSHHPPTGLALLIVAGLALRRRR